MPPLPLAIAAAVAACLLIVATYFLVVTRGSLIWQSIFDRDHKRAHIYWIYSKRLLIDLTDRQFVISAILLFNYRRIATRVVAALNPSLRGKRVLQVSCAFGNITERIVRKCEAEGASKVVIADIIPNELEHARAKLKVRSLDGICAFTLSDAVNQPHPDAAFDYVVLFFLFHELPYDKKVEVLLECARVLRPGGRIVFGEFHRPTSAILRISGQCFFWVFEKYAHEMWSRFDPTATLMARTDCAWECSRETFMFGNYQVFTAKKLVA